MKIAQVAPLTESVPPRLYGGTERVVAVLSDELVRLGHDVTLFASGDSRTRATLAAAWPRALRLDGCEDMMAPHLLMLEQVAKRAHEFDVVHFHLSQFHFSLARRLETPHVTTLHGRLDLAELPALFDEFTDIPVVSISDAQREPLPHANWAATIYHGLPSDVLRFSPRPDGYLAFLGRISPEKGVDRAIAIATRSRCRLKIAAKIDNADRQYFERDIRHLLDHPLVEFIGEIDEKQKAMFLGGATALLFPIDWPEPFGLVMIEAMACGTPVVAFRGGSVEEIIDPGATGYVVDSVDEAVAAVGRIGRLSRRACRTEFERRFSARRMAIDHLRLYEALVADRAELVAGRAGIAADRAPLVSGGNQVMVTGAA
jgi:glycosyltransferase involved in cell wall biosynthesis